MKEDRKRISFDISADLRDGIYRHLGYGHIKGVMTALSKELVKVLDELDQRYERGSVVAVSLLELEAVSVINKEAIVRMIEGLNISPKKHYAIKGIANLFPEELRKPGALIELKPGETPDEAILRIDAEGAAPRTPSDYPEEPDDNPEEGNS